MANFELTRELIDQLQTLIEQKNEELLTEVLKELHPADIAEIYDELSIDEAKYLYFLLDDDVAADVLIELEEEDRVRFLKALPSEVIARRFIGKMDSDDAADVMSELDEERQKEILSYLDDINTAGDIVDLLTYGDNTAGGLMAKEFIRVKESWSIITCLRSMRRQAEEVDEIYFVYVVDNDGILKGTLSLKKMLLSSTDTLVRDIYNPDVISVGVDIDSEEVANIMDKYDLVVLPVIDGIGRLVGRITIDDVVDVMREEADKDYQMASGITQDVEAGDSIWRLTRARIPWLIIGLVGGLFGSRVIGLFRGNISAFPEVAFFMPMIAAMGGNVGIQSSAIMVQSIANGTLGLESNFRKLTKELSVALLNASALSSLAFLYNFFIGSGYALTFTVASAMFSVVMFASLFGTFLPLLLDRMKIDPAVATGPFITTLNDITGTFVYLTLSAYFFTVFN
ncbi:magnesium transporter [Geofilum sp. OHC36d9]|uniref:magnesium transporter n=1 Tax=Geofilum sp. OHC36d9 TaxID=3458413 RepID=UPI0040345BB1